MQKQRWYPGMNPLTCACSQEYWPALLQFLREHKLSSAPGLSDPKEDLDSDDSWSHGGLDSGDEAAGAQAVAAGEHEGSTVQRRGGVRVQHTDP